MENWVNCWKPKSVSSADKVISSQAKRSTKSILEGSETRSVTSARNNLIHERPAPQMRVMI
jgi:hypothetical protein